MIPIAKPLIGEEEKRAVLDVLGSGQLAQGKKVEEFEIAFADYIGVKYAIATANGTTALHTALLAHNIGADDEVITTPFSFIATANAITMTGARPVFVDVEEKSFNLNPDLIEKAITKKTKAILPVHLFGCPVQMDKLMEIADKHKLILIEDACQAHGAEFNGKKVGSFGTGCFSFYPTKNMTTSEGGMITTNDEKIAAEARKIINHGSSKKYYHDYLGYNYRMTDIAAAIGLEQLKKLNFFNEKRRKNAWLLNSNLTAVKGIILPVIVDGHVFHQYTIRVTPTFKLSRTNLINHLSEQEIDSTVFYPVPLHKQKAYSGYNKQNYPVTERLSLEVLSLPVHPSLMDKELAQISEAIRNI